MPIVNRIADLHGEIADWRRYLHANPELLYDVHGTAATVAEKLTAFGCDEVVSGIGRTGVVGVINGNRPGGTRKVIGLRADMDALPIEEASDLPYKSATPGKMHACGHDGHTAMLLGAAKYLAESRNFAGTAVMIFQPAEEGGAGGAAMVKDGLMERFAIEEVYGMHNAPGLPVGEFAIRTGPTMASTDNITVEIEGIGAHAAQPHLGIDPIIVGAQIVTGLQTIVSRNVDPLEAAVVSICTFRAGNADNVIPQTALLRGTARSLKPHVRELIARRVADVIEGTARLYGAKVDFKWRPGYPVLSNHERETAFAASIAGDVAGASRVETNMTPIMGGEDFSYMLEARPGAFIFVGNGESYGLHNPRYNFNDDAIPYGTSYWVRLVETAMAG
jgi:hippurate hydrolase